MADEGMKNKRYIEHVIQDDVENIIKIIVEERDKDSFLVTYYDVKNNAEIRVGGSELHINALFELIRRKLRELAEEIKIEDTKNDPKES